MEHANERGECSETDRNRGEKLAQHVIETATSGRKGFVRRQSPDEDDWISESEAKLSDVSPAVYTELRVNRTFAALYSADHASRLTMHRRCGQLCL